MIPWNIFFPEPTMDEDRELPQIRRESYLGLFLALLTGVGFLGFMIFVSGGFFFYVLLMVAVCAGVGLFHYVLWGEALMRETAAERQAQEEKDRWETPLPPLLPPPPRPSNRGEDRIRRRY